jgi:SAM-dependent methyltransferase
VGSVAVCGQRGVLRARRVAYPADIADALEAELALDGTGRLLDVGCGPGSLTLLLAGLFASATGLDADADMLAEGARHAASAGITNVRWVNLRAEALPAELGRFRVITLAQSFHWMDRPVVAGLLHGMLAVDGALVHVGATNHRGIDSDAVLPYPGRHGSRSTSSSRRISARSAALGRGSLAITSAATRP